MVSFIYQRSNVPVWFTRAMDSLSKALNSGPVLLGSIDSADLNTVYPAPGHSGSQIFLTDLDRVAVSDGTDWKRTDTGAIV